MSAPIVDVRPEILQVNAVASLESLNYKNTPWEHPEDPRKKAGTYESWRDGILSMIPEGEQKYRARQNLSVLDQQQPDATQCPRQQAPDAKQLAAYLVTLTCSAKAAPHVARGLIRNGRIGATGVEIATIADRLRGGKADAKTCPGVKGFTDGDWEHLDQLVARVQEAAAKTSQH